MYLPVQKRSSYQRPGGTERRSCLNEDRSFDRPQELQKILMCLSPEAVLNPEIGMMGLSEALGHAGHRILRSIAKIAIKNSI